MLNIINFSKCFTLTQGTFVYLLTYKLLGFKKKLGFHIDCLSQSLFLMGGGILNVLTIESVYSVLRFKNQPVFYTKSRLNIFPSPNLFYNSSFKTGIFDGIPALLPELREIHTHFVFPAPYK